MTDYIINTRRLRAISVCRYENNDWEINIPVTELNILEKLKEPYGPSSYCHRILIYNKKTQWGYHPYDYYINTSGKINYRNIIFPTEIKSLLNINFIKQSKNRSKKKFKNRMKNTSKNSHTSFIIKNIEIVSKITNEFLKDYLESEDTKYFNGWKRIDFTFKLTGVKREINGKYDIQKIGQQFLVKRGLENNFHILKRFYTDVRHADWKNYNKKKLFNILNLINISTNKYRDENKIFHKILLRRSFKKLKNYEKETKNNWYYVLYIIFFGLLTKKYNIHLLYFYNKMLGYLTKYGNMDYFLF
jgi:hypothetical protein